MDYMAVYEKTALGYNEFLNEKRTLHFKERQVLLLINGTRSIDNLEKLFKREHLNELILKLESKGYIQLIGHNPIVEKTSVTHTPYFVSDLTFTTINSEKLATIKTILTNATDDYLGIMGRSIKERVEICNNEVSLKSCISTWHMAMRESKLGRESASVLLEQIHQTLENNNSGY
ncbi:MAG: hypothetical protein Q7T58_00285 [Methylotenera sp.]|nr:hypothetical protein [Methylotenera sp.]